MEITVAVDGPPQVHGAAPRRLCVHPMLVVTALLWVIRRPSTRNRD